MHDDVRLLADATIEKDESHAGKVVERSYYQRNKHIFPASRWEVRPVFRLGSYSRGSSLCLHSIGLRSGKELWKVYYRVKIGTASENREKNLVALYAGCFNHIVRSGRRCVDMRNFYYILQMCGRRRHSFGNVIFQFRHAENATLEILAHYSVHFTSTSAIASTLLRFKCASGGQGCRRVIKFCFSHNIAIMLLRLGCVRAVHDRRRR